MGIIGARSAVGRPSVGGVAQLSIPGARGIGTVTAQALTVGQLRYVPYEIVTPRSFDMNAFEVTVAPASDANVRIGITACNTNLQPIGAPLLDQAVPVASGFTGVKSPTFTELLLPPGIYLGVVNCDVAMTLRAIAVDAAEPTYAVTLGASPFTNSLVVTSAYGALPTPCPAWTTATAASATMRHVLFWRTARFL